MSIGSGVCSFFPQSKKASDLSRVSPCCHPITAGRAHSWPLWPRVRNEAAIETRLHESMYRTRSILNLLVEIAKTKQMFSQMKNKDTRIKKYFCFGWEKKIQERASLTHGAPTVPLLPLPEQVKHFKETTSEGLLRNCFTYYLALYLLHLNMTWMTENLHGRFIDLVTLQRTFKRQVTE